MNITEIAKAKLIEVGVHIHSGGFAYEPFTSAFHTNALACLWHESEEPTDAEIAQLAAYVQAKAAHYQPGAVGRGYFVEGHNTVTFVKRDGLWAFRRMTWTEGPTWYPKPADLATIIRRAG